MKAEAKFFQDGQWKAGAVLETVVIRATSVSDPPKVGSFLPLNRDSDRLAFLHAWASAKRDGSDAANLKAFLAQARSVRVACQHASRFS